MFRDLQDVRDYQKLVREEEMMSDYRSMAIDGGASTEEEIQQMSQMLEQEEMEAQGRAHFEEHMAQQEAEAKQMKKELENEIKVKLIQLDATQYKLAKVQEELERLRDEILTEDIKAQLQDLEVEFKAPQIALQVNIKILQSEIKDMIILGETTVKAEVSPDKFLSAVYVKPRTSWDNKALETYAEAYPEILGCRKTGKPSVRFQ